MPIGKEQPAKIRLFVDSSLVDRGLKAATRAFDAFGVGVERTFSKIVNKAKMSLTALPGAIKSSIKSSLKAIPASFGKAGLGLSKGAFGTAKEFGIGIVRSVADGVVGAATQGFDDVVQFEKAMTRFQIAGGVTNGAMQDLRVSLDAVSKSTGISRNELIAGASAYVSLTGDAAGAASQVGLFAKVALASGAEMGDIATAAAALKDNLKIDPSQFEGAFSALIEQGKAGAIELKDLAAELSGIAPLFTQFKGGTGVQGLATLGAALQAGRKGFGSASEATTGLQALIVAFTRNAKKFKGVKIFDKDPKTGIKTFKSFREIVDQIAESKLAKDPNLLTDAFGSVEAKRFFDQLVANRDMLDELEKKSSEGKAVATDSLAYQTSAAGQLEIAMNNLKLSVTKAFTPELIASFASALEKVAALAGKIVDAIVAVTEYSDVTDADEKRQAELVKLGAYTGDDFDMQVESKKNEILQERETARLAPLREAKRVLAAAGSGALAAEPTSLTPYGQSVIGPQKPEPQQSRMPAPPAAVAPITLNIDGNAVATSVSNARQSRREIQPR